MNASGEEVQRSMRVTDADLTLLRECRRSRSSWDDGGVVYWSEYRRKGSVTTFRLVSKDDKPATIVTKRAKRLLALGLVERCLMIGQWGPDGDLVMTEAGRALVDSGSTVSEADS